MNQLWSLEKNVLFVLAGWTACILGKGWNCLLDDFQKARIVFDIGKNPVHLDIFERYVLLFLSNPCGKEKVIYFDISFVVLKYSRVN